MHADLGEASYGSIEQCSHTRQRLMQECRRTACTQTLACGADSRCWAFDAAAGARRGVLNLPGVKEDVGMIGIHYGGTFVELVPWAGTVSWDVAPWGRCAFT